MSLSLYAVPGCRVEHVRQRDGQLLLVVRAQAPGAPCPTCRRRSTAPHGTYVRRPADPPTRRPADLPSLGQGVRLEVHVRRFSCQNTGCARRTFAEPLHGLLDPRAQRTRRLAAAQRTVAVQAGGEAGARLLTHLAMPTSADTLLRLVRRAPLPSRQTPRALGVDDWALRRGRTYGTILVDLEAHHIVDLLPDRTAATLAAWLRAHPAVEVIARDRSTEYMRAATTAAPHAMQVADRWHLLVNVREMAERWLMSVYPRLRRLSVSPSEVPNGLAPDAPADGRASAVFPPRRDRAFPKTAAERQRSADSAARWRAVYDEVRRRHAAGEPIMRISRTLGVAHGTVRRFVRAVAFPERAPHRRQPSLLDPYLAHLLARHAAGCENAQQLWREIRAQGYPGRPSQVRRWLQERRRAHAPTGPRQYRRPLSSSRTSAGALLPSPKQLAWLLVRVPHDLPAPDAEMLRHLMQDPEAMQVMALVRRFVTLLRDGRGDVSSTRASFDRWLDDAVTCGVRAVETFARGLAQDGAAVRAAVTTPWSNGQTEGQVTKLKLLKRQMYGRAKLDLLQRRLILAA